MGDYRRDGYESWCRSTADACRDVEDWRVGGTVVREAPAFLTVGAAVERGDGPNRRRRPRAGRTARAQ
ncbi:hypothetical protein V1291_002302 [Nitrobacteraceae bacterium AZCC 1564]